MNKILLVDIIKIRGDNVEDENKILTIIKISKVLIIIIIIALVAFLIISAVTNTKNKKENENKVSNEGYENAYEDNWVKTIEATPDNNYTTTVYSYNSASNTFSKTENSNLETGQREIYYKYNSHSNLIEINFSFDGYDDNNQSCTIRQSATYSRKNQEFACKVDSVSGNCSSYCSLIKNKIEEFNNELDNTLKNNSEKNS